MSSIAIAQEIKRRGRPRKGTVQHINKDNPLAGEDKKMTPTTGQEKKTKRTQMTVFDLTSFDDIKLLKDVVLPEKPADLETAVNLIGSTDKILELIYIGMCDEATELARKDMTGWKVETEESELGEDYTGKFADEAKGKLIGNAVLTLAKLNGYDKSLSKEKKNELKDKAKKFLRDNPAMIAGMQG